MNVQMGPARTGAWAAAGPSAGDTAYRTQSLKFQPVETNLDESVSLQTVLLLVVRAAFVSITAWLLFFVVWVVALVLTFSSQVDSFGTEGEAATASGQAYIFLIGQIVPVLLFWLLLLLPKLEEPIAEWRTLLENKAAAASSAYAAIYGSLARRRIPVNAAAMRVRSDILSPEAVNNRLVISDRAYHAYVSVFPYGTSLYVGWSMYRHRRGVVLVGIFLKDLFASVVGRTGLTNQMLRTEKVRAMREAVHSAVREGVEVAVQGVEVPMAATFGQDIPIQDLTMTQAVLAPSAASGAWQAPTSAPRAAHYPTSAPPIPPPHQPSAGS